MKITDEIKEQINELYLEIGVKKRVAEIIGCSPATVSKYIIKDYVPRQQRVIERFDKSIVGVDALIDSLRAGTNRLENFCKACELSKEEWEDLKVLQKEIF